MSLRTQFRAPTSARRPATPARNVRPQLEALEERAVPASILSLDPATFNQFYVESLYSVFLHREGDVKNPNDAGGWVAQLNAGKLTSMQVANDIVHSTEALGVVVDGLYTKLLNRASDPVGKAGFVSFLERGGTVEEVIAAVASSQEFASLTPGGNTGFVQSLYNDLLGRSASDAEVSNGLSLLSGHGRSALASSIVNSGEYRTDEVNQLYGIYFDDEFGHVFFDQPSPVVQLYPEVLERNEHLGRISPSAAEVSGAVNSAQGILPLEAVFAGSSEFFYDVTHPVVIGA
jgi:hypothetical protein